MSGQLIGMRRHVLVWLVGRQAADDIRVRSCGRKETDLSAYKWMVEDLLQPYELSPPNR